MKKLIIFGLFVVLISLYSSFVSSQSIGFCCLEPSGYCSPNKAENKCKDSGGIIQGVGACYGADGVSPYTSCKLNACLLFNGKCSVQTTARCESVLNGIVNSEITEEQCSEMNVPVDVRGCCVSSDESCSASLRTQCKESFFEKNCNQLTQCQGKGGEVRQECSEDGRKVISMNRFGVREIEELSEDEACVIEGSKVSRKSTSCKVGEETRIITFNLDSGQSLFKKEVITEKMLGAFKGEKVNERKNGESWCIIFGSNDGTNWDLYPKFALEEDNDLRIKYSAGQRHYVYTCKNGDITADPGDLFRGKEGICFQNDEIRYYLDGTPDEWVATCDYKEFGYGYGSGNDKKSMEDKIASSGAIASGPRNRQKKDVNSGLVNYLRGFSQAKLMDNYEFTNGCKEKNKKPRYSVGNQFYDVAVTPVNAPPKKCGQCGDGFWNRCASEECYKLGDCSAKGREIWRGVFGGVIPDCIKGAVIAEVTYLTAGSAGLHEGGGWGTVFSSGSPATVPSSPTIPTGPTGPPATSSGSVPFVPPEGGSPVVAQQVIAREATKIASEQAAYIIVKEGGQSTSQEVANYLVAASTANSLVRATFGNDRNVRDAPSLDADIVGNLNGGGSVDITETTSDSNGNIWGRTADGRFVMLNSPDGTNPARLTRVQNTLSPGDIETE